jgi:hypothetical protein
LSLGGIVWRFSFEHFDATTSGRPRWGKKA